MADQRKKLSEAEIDRRMAMADGVLGAAGHEVTDPASRDIIRRKIAGEITPEEAERQLLARPYPGRRR